MARLTPEQLREKYKRKESSFLPTFQYLWQELLTDFDKVSLDRRAKNILKKSVGDLPTILDPLLKEPATVENILQARILFAKYALGDELPKKLSRSKSMSHGRNMARGDSKAYYIRWFDNQIRECEQKSNRYFPSLVKKDVKPLGHAGNDLHDPFLALEEETKKILQGHEITIAELLLIQPNAIYRIPFVH